MGPVHTLPSFYDDVDVILIASTGDAGPSCFLEAGACGVPSISTRIGFPAETIRDGENGMFVGRSIDEMAKAIIYLYNHRGLLKDMSEKIRHDVEMQWSYKERGKLWECLFEESLQRV
jgi:glycosyltransferase involved in cell wall biosynthesis